MNRASLFFGSRLAALVGAAVVLVSMMSVWGPDKSVGVGPPGTWQKPVVGALLLSILCALALLVFGKGRGARVFATLCSVGAVAIAIHVYVGTQKSLFDYLVEGRGWPSLMIGAGLSAAACAVAWLTAPKLSKPRRK